MTIRHNNVTSLLGNLTSRTVGALSFTPVSLTGVNMIDAEHMGYAWAGTSLTYAFPDSPDDYSYPPEKDDNFAPFSTAMQDVARYFLDTSFGTKANDGFSVEGFTGLMVSPGADADANLRYAQTGIGTGAYANFPGEGDAAGDMWFGTGANFGTASQGDWRFKTFAHETGHALGLKHGHITATAGDKLFPALDAKYDSQEYSIMTYRSYVGQITEAAYIEERGYPQTFMMADIAALQDLYGANFTVNSGSTVYKWQPDSGNTWVNGQVGIGNTGNVIFATIWDGGGAHDTYDLSAYADNLKIDLRPGKYSVFSADQLSDLDWYNTPGVHIARGSIFNALQYNGNTRSLIEDAKGGSGSDLLTGNGGRNTLVGNAGNDSFIGYQGNDIYTGGIGRDVFSFSRGGDNDRITDFHIGRDTINLESFDFSAFFKIKALATDIRTGVTIDFGHGDTLFILGMHRADLHAGDFQI